MISSLIVPLNAVMVGVLLIRITRRYYEKHCAHNVIGITGICSPFARATQFICNTKVTHSSMCGPTLLPPHTDDDPI